MLRLADYFVVVGYDFEKSKKDEGQGLVIQRLPKDNWPDYKYETQVEMFCQPCGWELSDVKNPPTFFVAFLTDPEASIYFMACLSFHEAVSPSQLALGKHNGSVHSSLSKKASISNGSNRHTRNLSNSSALNTNGDVKPNMYLSDGSYDHDDEVCQEDPNLVKPADKFAPKCLILLARHGYFDVLKNCLSIIYSIYMDPHRQISLEYVVGNILSSVEVPPIGGSMISFTIGAGDKQYIQPPACSTLPVTRSCISMLFKHLGMQNVLLIYCSLINDQKILLYSRSLNRLTEGCHALRSLLYPLKYGNVFIPIIPKNIIDVLSTPTPFLAGVFSRYGLTYDLVDVITVDLDGGSVKYPEGIPSVQLSDPYYTIVIDSLTKILNPDLLTADEIYPPDPSPPPDPCWQDKQLRAVFIRLFCRLFAGYRSCLSLTRIRPKPVIHFNQLIFLLLRGLRNDNDEFITCVLNCMSFGQFIQDRGTPYRVCDIFDEEYDSMTEILRTRPDSLDDLAVIDKLAKKLYDNENRGKPVKHNLPSEARLGHTRLYAQQFQLLDENLVSSHIKANLRNKTSTYKPESAEPRFVPHGLELDMQIFKNEALTDKNKVIREFVANIFNNHITEALKRRNTIRQDLKNRLIRRIFIDELHRQLYPDQPADSCTETSSDSPYDLYSSGSITAAVYFSDISCERKALLEYQQFELINDLMGEALRQECQNEDSGVGPIIMDLSTKFCTQLGNIRYYSNMTPQIQDHPVWESQKFWINCFCDQVNNEIRQLYLHHSESQYRAIREVERQSGNLHTTGRHQKSKSQSDRSWAHNAGIASQPSLAGLSGSGRKNMHKFSGSISTTPSTNDSYQQQTGQGNAAVPSGNELDPEAGGSSSSGASNVYRKLYNNKMSALDMAAEEMKIIDISPDTQVQQQESSTIYAQILHFINLIVNFRIPLNIVAKTTAPTTAPTNIGGSHHHHHHQQGTNFGNVTHHAHFGDDDMSIDSNVSSGPNDNGGDDAGYVSARISSLEIWLKKFVDKTASDNYLSSSLIENIKSKIEGIIEGHISNLESIYPEEQIIPKVKKVEVTSPVLLPDEKVILINSKESLRCHLLLDGRHEKLDLQRQREQDFEAPTGYMMNQGNNARQMEDDDDYDSLRPLLPAQGALFLTNYRLVFRGAPKDPYQANKLVCRSFPIAGLKSIKKLGLKAFAQSGVMISQGLSWNFLANRVAKARGADGYLDVIRIRSNTFQMLKIGLEPEDTSQEIKEELTQKLNALRYPSRLNITFNISDRVMANHIKNFYNTGLPGDHKEQQSQIHQPRQHILIPEHKSATLSVVTNSDVDGSMNYAHTSNTIDSSSGGGDQHKFGSTGGNINNRGKLSGNVFGRNTLRIAREGINKFSRMKDRTPPSSTSKSKTISESESERSSAIHEDDNRDFILDATRSSSLAIDKRLLHRILQLPGYKEYRRLGILPENNFFDDDDESDSLLIGVHLSVNFNYSHQNVKSYPALIAVPSTFTEAKLKKVAKCHSKSRLPMITWYNRRTKGFLFRGATFQSKNIISRFLRQPSGQGLAMGGQSGQVLKNVSTTLQKPDHDNTASKEQVRYLEELVKISPSYDDIQNRLKNTPDPLVPWSDNCRQMSFQNRKNPFDKVYKNIKAGGEKARTMNRKNSKESISSSQFIDDNAEEESGSIHMFSSHSEDAAYHPAELRITPLYILGEKTYMKALSKSEYLRDVEFIAVEYTTKSQIKDAFDSLVKAALPDNVSTVSLTSTHHHHQQQQQQQLQQQQQCQQPTQQQYHSTHDGATSTGATGGLNLAASKWLTQIQSLLDLAGSVVDLMELQGASVAVCLEKGWDATAQVVSLAQVMMDPHYRTLAGFWGLVEKDWLLTGHPFQTRLCMTSNSANATTSHLKSAAAAGVGSGGSSSSSNCFPVFLQFLDAVHQLLHQFPMAFEFNDFLLRFLAYHHMSNRFHDFKADSEANRIQWMQSFTASLTSNVDLLESQFIRQCSIWYYIQAHHDEWPVFFNFYYCPSLSQTVLRPCTNLSMIEIWEYYLNEDLASGSVYDLDHFSPSYRKRNSQHYDPVLNGAFNNSHVESVYAILGLREGCEVRNWQQIWNKSGAEYNAQLESLSQLINKESNINKTDYCQDGDDMNENLEKSEYDNDATLKLTATPTKKLQLATINQVNNSLLMRAKYNRAHIEQIRSIVQSEHKRASLQRLEKRHASSQTAVYNELGSGPVIQIQNHRLQELLPHLKSQSVCQECKDKTEPPPSPDNIDEDLDKFETQALLVCTGCGVIVHEACLRCTSQIGPCSSLSHFGSTRSRIGDEHKSAASTSQFNSVANGNNNKMDRNYQQQSKSQSPSSAKAGKAESHTTAASSRKASASDQLKYPSSSSNYNLNQQAVSNHYNNSQPSHTTASPTSSESLVQNNRRHAGESNEPTSEIAFSGELYKLNTQSIIPSWQRKFFMLDVIHHAIFYYDMKDSVRKNKKRIELQEITGVRILTTIQNHQKRFPESAFLELQTETKVFKLASEDPAVINEWVEKIQNSIQ